MIIVNDDGSIKAWLNSGENPKGLPRGWVWTEQGPISPAVGDADGVRFADVTVCLSEMD